MSVILRCDGGCGAEIIQLGPNTGAFIVPEQWVQLSIERKNQPTITQHQCPRCFSSAAKVASERRNQPTESKLLK